MKIAKLWAVALPFLLVGCGGEDTNLEMEETPEVADTGPTTQGTGMEEGMQMDTGAGGMAGMSATVSLQSVNNSGVAGEATLSEQGGQGQVMVRLTGSQPQVTHQGHIHQGTCDSPGSVVAPLQPVTTGGDGTGTSTSTVNVPLSQVMDGQHIVAFHEAGGSPGPTVVCGEIPQHQM